jgi:hypothetical protein
MEFEQLLLRSNNVDIQIDYRDPWHIRVTKKASARNHIVDESQNSGIVNDLLIHYFNFSYEQKMV